MYCMYCVYCVYSSTDDAVLDSRPEDIDGIDIHWIKVDDLVTESEALRKHFDTAADLIGV